MEGGGLTEEARLLARSHRSAGLSTHARQLHAPGRPRPPPPPTARVPSAEAAGRGPQRTRVSASAMLSLLVGLTQKQHSWVVGAPGFLGLACPLHSPSCVVSGQLPNLSASTASSVGKLCKLDAKRALSASLAQTRSLGYGIAHAAHSFRCHRHDVSTGTSWHLGPTSGTTQTPRSGHELPRPSLSPTKEGTWEGGHFCPGETEAQGVR